MTGFLNSLNLTFRYPGIFLLLAIAAAWFVTGWYLRPLAGRISRQTHRLLFVNRWLILILLLLLFFQPRLNWNKAITVTPAEIVLIDNSRSPALSDTLYPAKIREQLSRLSAAGMRKGRVEVLLFGDSIRNCVGDTIHPSDRTTGLAELLTGRLSGENRGEITGVTIVSDGLFNRGDNPLNLKFPCRVNCVPAGKFDQTGDLALLSADFPDPAPAGSAGRWQITVAYQNGGAPYQAVLQIQRNRKILQQKELKIPPGAGELKASFEPGPPELPVDTVKISIQGKRPEKNLSNNSLVCYQQAPRSRDMVLLLQDTPTLDARFLGELLKREGYPVKRSTWPEFFARKESENYRIAVVFELPEEESNQAWLTLKKSAGGILLLPGSAFPPAKIHPLLGSSGSGSTQEGYPADLKNPVSDFLYQGSNGQLTMQGLPPVRVQASLNLPVRRYLPVLNCKIGETVKPAGWLVAAEDEKLAVLNLENFWRLIFEVHNRGGNENFSRFLLNIIDYLSLTGKTERLTVAPVKPVYEKGEPVQFTGRYLDRNLKPAKDRQIRIRLKNRPEEIVLVGSAEEATGTIPVTEPGFYEYLAEVKESDQSVYRTGGSFQISATSLESQKTAPDTLLLAALAAQNRGRLIPLDSLAAYLTALPDSTISQIEAREYLPAGELPLLLLLVLLLTIEWLWRKISRG